MCENAPGPVSMLMSCSRWERGGWTNKEQTHQQSSNLKGQQTLLLSVMGYTPILEDIVMALIVGLRLKVVMLKRGKCQWEMKANRTQLHINDKLFRSFTEAVVTFWLFYWSTSHESWKSICDKHCKTNSGHTASQSKFVAGALRWNVRPLAERIILDFLCCNLKMTKSQNKSLVTRAETGQHCKKIAFIQCFGLVEKWKGCRHITQRRHHTVCSAKEEETGNRERLKGMTGYWKKSVQALSKAKQKLMCARAVHEKDLVNEEAKEACVTINVNRARISRQNNVSLLKWHCRSFHLLKVAQLWQRNNKDKPALNMGRCQTKGFRLNPRDCFW